MGSAMGPYRTLAALASTTCAGADVRRRQTSGAVYALSRIFDLTTARVRTNLARAMIPGVEGSILKQAEARLATAVADAGCTLLGPQAH